MPVSDCTLRDTRGAPGVCLEVEEAVAIARLLADLGIEEIEAGVLNRSKSEERFFRAILDARLNAEIAGLYFCTDSRTVDDSLNWAVDLGLKNVCISIPTSDRFISAKLKRSERATLVLMSRAVEAAAKRGLNVAFSGEDAARSEPKFLLEYVKIGQESGATRFRFAESVACLSPKQMSQRIGSLKEAVDIPIEVHCHSAYGLAVANSIAAIEAGASWVSVTIDGIGERGGNTPLAPIIMYLHKFHAANHYSPSALVPLSRTIAGAIVRATERFAPIVGEHAFAYELGQQYQAHETYEDFPPEMVGNQRMLVFGMKFDRHAFEHAFGIPELDPGTAEAVRSHVSRNRLPLTVEGLKSIIEDGKELHHDAG